MYRYFRTFTAVNLDFLFSWESKGFFNETFASTKTSNYNHAPRLVYDNAKIREAFSGDLLKHDKVRYKVEK